MNCTRIVRSRLVTIGLCSALGALTATATARAQEVPDQNDAVGQYGIDAALAARAEALKRSGSPTVPTKAAPQETPPPPVTEGSVPKPGFVGKPLTYSVDLSSMVEGGPTDDNFANLPGGLDAGLTYRLDRTTRLAANYYQFSAIGIGNDDLIPYVFQGTTKPLALINGQKEKLDATTHLRFQTYAVQQMFFVGGRHHPLVIAPIYASIRSSIGDKDDFTPIFADGTFMSVHQRSYESQGLALFVPLFYGEKYLISYSGSVMSNVNTNGANLTNHPQYAQYGFAQYQPNQDTTLFTEYVGAISYFPTESYPYHVPTFHYGVSRYFKRPFFVEAEVSTGGPSNPNYYLTNKRIGIPAFVVPCASTAAGGAPTAQCGANAVNGVSAPFIGAQRFTTFSLIIGIGSAPLVRPF